MVKVEELLKEQEWLHICNFWNQLSEVQKNNDHNKYETLTASFKLIHNNLTVLVNKNVINEEEKEFVKNVFKDRLSYLEFKLFPGTCYRVSEDTGLLFRTCAKLEDRYKILKKLFKEDKINSETFLKTQQLLKSDIQSLEFKRKINPEDYINNDLIDILTYLNK